MNAEEIIEKVKDAIVETKKVERESILLNQVLATDLEIDEIDAVEMLMELEDTFNIEIEDEDAEKWVTVADVVSYLERRMI
jgi:acyl carrier protein